MSNYLYPPPDPVLGKLFAAAEAELQAVAKSHGFDLRLVDDGKGTWFFYPEVKEFGLYSIRFPIDWTHEQIEAWTAKHCDFLPRYEDTPAPATAGDDC
jgi:hypothetical protein